MLTPALSVTMKKTESQENGQIVMYPYNRVQSAVKVNEQELHISMQMPLTQCLNHSSCRRMHAV